MTSRIDKGALAGTENDGQKIRKEQKGKKRKLERKGKPRGQVSDAPSLSSPLPSCSWETVGG